MVMTPARIAAILRRIADEIEADTAQVGNPGYPSTLQWMAWIASTGDDGGGWDALSTLDVALAAACPRVDYDGAWPVDVDHQCVGIFIPLYTTSLTSRRAPFSGEHDEHATYALAPVDIPDPPIEYGFTCPECGSDHDTEEAIDPLDEAAAIELCGCVAEEAP